MIIYFSGTGNSRSIAQKIALDGERTEEIFDIKEDVLKDGRIGIVFPVYCADIPHALYEFLKRVRLDSPYIFSIATAGGGAGRSHGSVAYLLKEKGTELSYSDTVIMPDSCIVFATPEKLREKLLLAEDARAGEIRAATEIGKKNSVRPSLPEGALNRFMWKFFGFTMGLYNKKVTESCVGCGLCSAGCPVNNIEMKDGKASFVTGKCENCFRCIQSCPERAIEFGRLKVTDRTQYLHK